ncbi:MAG: hypothetical protein JXR68_08865 [Bacteroidales bacterium]|nr:hypothetical protein [Bacteroidales bacterium]
MRRSIFFIATLFISVSIFAQPAKRILDEISAEFSVHLSNEVFKKNVKIYNTAGKKPLILFQVENIYNSNGQITELSKELSYRLAYDLQAKLNSTAFSTNDYTVTSPYDFATTRQRLDSTQMFDYTLVGQYVIGNDEIVLNKFRLCHIHSDFEVTFPDFVYLLDTVEHVRKYDTLLHSASALQQLVDLNKDNVLISEASLSYVQSDVPSVDIQGVGQVYKVEYDKEYNLRLQLKKPVYIYAFFYDPLDENYPFIWAIENQNVKFSKGNYNDFWTQPIAFYQTGQAAPYSYVKVIASSQKIDIDKYYTRKFIDGYEAVILENDNCEILLDHLSKLSDIQTINLILTFE